MTEGTAKKYLIKTHQELRAQNHETLRQNVVEVANLLLTDEGPQSITVRRVAEELDCSTKIIYSMFKNKDGLANELYLVGCSRLRETLATVAPDSNPATYLTRLGWAYWDFAQANPNYYAFMFGGALADFKPDEKSLGTLDSAFQLMLNVVQGFVEQGLLPPTTDVASVSKMLWATLHGVLDLSFGGHFPDKAFAQSLYSLTMATLVTGLFNSES